MWFSKLKYPNFVADGEKWSDLFGIEEQRADYLMYYGHKQFHKHIDPEIKDGEKQAQMLIDAFDAFLDIADNQQEIFFCVFELGKITERHLSGGIPQEVIDKAMKDLKKMIKKEFKDDKNVKIEVKGGVQNGKKRSKNSTTRRDEN